MLHVICAFLWPRTKPLREFHHFTTAKKENSIQRCTKFVMIKDAHRRPHPQRLVGVAGEAKWEVVTLSHTHTVNIIVVMKSDANSSQLTETSSKRHQLCPNLLQNTIFGNEDLPPRFRRHEQWRGWLWAVVYLPSIIADLAYVIAETKFVRSPDAKRFPGLFVPSEHYSTPFLGSVVMIRIIA